MSAITTLANTSNTKYAEVVNDSDAAATGINPEHLKTLIHNIFIKVDEALAKTNTHTNDIKTAEEIQDIVGAMFTSNTETRISATYVDGAEGAGKINLVVDDLDTDSNTTYAISVENGDNTDEEKIRITASTGGTDDIVLEAGTGLTIARDGDKITFTNTVTDTTYTVGDGGLTQNNFTNDDHTKLNGIAAGAEVNVQADWNEASSGSDAFIANKPTIPAAVTNYVTNNADDEMLGTLTLKKASDDATCRELIFLKERASSVSSNDGDLAGEITFKAYNDAGSPELIEVAQISATFADVSDSNETGKLEFKVAPPDEYSETNHAVTGLTLQGAGGNYQHIDVTMGTPQGTVAHNCPDNIFRYSSNINQAGRVLLQPANPGGGGTTNTQFIMEAWNDRDDIFKILVDDAGATTLSTIDDGGAAAHLTLDADGDITLDAASGNIYVKDNGGNYTPGSDYEIATKKYVDDNAGGGGGASALNDLSDVTYSSGDLTISSLDKIISGGLTFASNFIVFDSGNAGYDLFQIKADSSANAIQMGGEDGNYSVIQMFEEGGTSTDDFFRIFVEANGETQITTEDNAGASAHLKINPDGQLKLDKPPRVKEQASADADQANYGQIWVKNDTPNNLYFTNDAGNDVQITNGSSLAGGGGGGTDTWAPQWSMRWYTRYNYYYYPSSTYGANYYNWNAAQVSALTSWNDSYNPCIVVPKDMTIKSYHLYGNYASAQTLALCIKKGTPSYGSAGNTSLSTLGSEQTLVVGTASIYVKMEETGLSVSLSAGDIIIPTLRRTTTNTSSYYMFEGVLNIVGEYT